MYCVAKCPLYETQGTVAGGQEKVKLGQTILELELGVDAEGFTGVQACQVPLQAGKGMPASRGRRGCPHGKNADQAVFRIPWAPLATGPEAKTSVHEADGDQPPIVQ